MTLTWDERLHSEEYFEHGHVEGLPGGEDGVRDPSVEAAIEEEKDQKRREQEVEAGRDGDGPDGAVEDASNVALHRDQGQGFSARRGRHSWSKNMKS